MTVLNVEDVKRHLNITGATQDGELMDVVAAAEAAVTLRVGPLAAVTTTSRIAGGGTVLVLPVSPVISLTSITDSFSSTLTLGDFTLDAPTGVVSYTTGSAWFSSDYYTVVYQAGRTTVPADIKYATLELVRHLWESQRSPARFPGSTINEGPVASPGSMYLMPIRVKELLEPHMQFKVT